MHSHGIYAHVQIVAAARAHGVELRPVCINAFRWDRMLEPIDDEHFTVRLAEADAFRSSMRLARREALCAIKSLRDEQLPLFAAADARENGYVAEIVETPVLLKLAKADGALSGGGPNPRDPVGKTPGRGARLLEEQDDTFGRARNFR